MASFLALEALCNRDSLTPTQAAAVFEASKQAYRQPQYYEDAVLDDQGQRAGGKPHSGHHHPEKRRYGRVN